MPFPVELYIGDRRTTHLLLFVQNGSVKLYSPTSNSIVLCKPLAKLVRLYKDRRSNLFRAFFTDLKPLIFYSRFHAHLFREIQSSLKNQYQSGDRALFYTTYCSISSKANPFEVQNVRIMVNFFENELFVNDQRVQSQHITGLQRTAHELMVYLSINQEPLVFKFNNFVEARAFYTVMYGFLQFNEFSDQEINTCLSLRFGYLEIEKAIV